MQYTHTLSFIYRESWMCNTHCVYLYQPMLKKWPSGLQQVSTQLQQKPEIILRVQVSSTWTGIENSARWRAWHNFYLVPMYYHHHHHHTYREYNMQHSLKSACHYQFECDTFWQMKYVHRNFCVRARKYFIL